MEDRFMRIIKLTQKRDKPWGKWIKFRCPDCRSVVEYRFSETIPFDTYGSNGVKEGFNLYVRCMGCNNVLHEHVSLTLLWADSLQKKN